MTSVHTSVSKSIFTCETGTTTVKEMKKFAIFYSFLFYFLHISQKNHRNYLNKKNLIFQLNFSVPNVSQKN